MSPITFLTGAALGATTTWASRRWLTNSRHKAEEGLADWLLWALLIDDGVILMKDGTLLGGLTFRGRDMASAPTEELNRAAVVVRQALGQLGPGFSYEVNVHRTERQYYPPARLSDFPTLPLRMVDAERREMFMQPERYYTTTNTLLVSYTPPATKTRWIDRLFVQGGEVGQDCEQMVQAYKKAMAELERQLGAMLRVQRLNSKALVTECHRTLSGDPTPVDPPFGYLCDALATGTLAKGYEPRFNNQHVFVITIPDWGESITVAAGNFFNDIAETCRWHIRFVALSYHAAEKRIRTRQKGWFSQRQGMRAFMPGNTDSVLEDPHAVEMQQNTASAHSELSSGISKFGFASNALIVRDTNRERGHARASDVLQKVRDAGMPARMETLNATTAFLGSLPGHGRVNMRRLMMSSRALSHLFPITMPWPGPPHNPSALMPPKTPPLMVAGGKGSMPFNLHLHHGDVAHTLVVGATGAGKSVLVGALMMSWLRYPRSRVFCFDVGGSHEVLTRAAGGEYIDFGKDTTPALQPLRHLETETDRRAAENWIATLCSVAGHRLSAEDLLDVAHAVGLTAAETAENRTLTTLHVNLPRAVQTVVEPYTSKGSLGRVFDGVQKKKDSTARMRTVEMRDALGLGQNVAAPLLMTLFRQVERSLDGSPTLIVIEEAWAALMRTDYASRMQQWLLTLRKQNAAVVIVAHSPAQIKALPNAQIITDSCPTRILLPNAEARTEEQKAVYRSLDLGDREIETIARATPKQEYYFKSPAGSRLFDLALGPHARTLLMPLPGMNVRESKSHIRHAMRRHGDRFLNHTAIS